jgi:hypothetical protein
MSNPLRKLGLATIEVAAPDSTRHGRVFLPATQLDSLDLGALTVDFGRRFVEDDDLARLELLGRAMALRAITVETYPGETTPVELHAYVRAPEVSMAPIFGCVLATTAVVDHILAAPPHLVLETASFQVIGDDASPASVLAGLQAWAARVWPGEELPKVRLAQWPAKEVSTFLRSPRLHLTTTSMTGAPEALTARDFPTPEELQHP